MARPVAERGARLALLSETLLVGVYVLAGSLLVVTAPAALAAGVAYLRRHVAARDASAAGFWRDWRAAVGRTWGTGLIVLVAAVWLAVNRLLLAAGAVPDGRGVVWPLMLVAGASVASVVLRAAGRWSDAEGLPDDAPGPGARLVAGLPAAWSLTRDDPVGALLLAVAVGLCGVLLWMLPALVLVVGGLLALAVVGVEARRTGSPGPED